MKTDNEITPVLAANIIRARKEVGMSRLELAEAAECSTQSILNYEKGDQDPSHKMLCKIAKILDKSWLWFYQDSSQTPEEMIQVPKSDWENYRQLQKIVSSLVAEKPKRNYRAFVGPGDDNPAKVNRKLPGYHRGLLDAATLEGVDPVVTQRLWAEAQRRVERNKPIAS